MLLQKLPIASFALLSSTASAFYLPGVAPTTYENGSIVPLNVNPLTPARSEKDPQLRSIISYDYYHPAFRFCRPDGGPKDVSESLGSILFGDRILTSPFELKMGVNESCKSLCEPKPEYKFDKPSALFTNQRILQNYNFNMLIDGLPAGQPYVDPSTDTEFTLRGFPLGEVDDQNKPALNNHIDLVINYHEAAKGKFRVVGVLALPSSRPDTKRKSDGDAECGDPNVKSKKLYLDDQGGLTEVTWTYGVYWVESRTAWATRWDTYLHVYDPRIHWFSLINSAIIVVFLCGMVAAIVTRALKKDIARYNRLDSFNLDDLSGSGGEAEDGVQEDSGWKLVHGDAFRTPKNPLLLSVFLGNGVQLFVMTGCTIVFALLGFLSPSNRGSLGTVMILLYTIFGFIGGYISARVYKSFGGEAWKRNIAMTPILVPGIVFATFFLLNLFLWAKHSSGAVPFTTMLVILAIWFVISVPLSFAGSWVGFRHAVSGVPPVDGAKKLMHEAAHHASSAGKPDPTANSTEHDVSEALAIHAPCWHSSVRCHFRRAILYHEQHVVWHGLLHVWLPLLDIYHHDHHLRRGQHLASLFPPLQRKLPLAVEIVHYRRRLSWLCFRKCDAVLDNSTQLWQLYLRGALSRIQLAAELFVLHSDR